MYNDDILTKIDVNTHSSICIHGESTVYIDPLDITGEPHDADLILITHPHFDHFSPKDIRKILKEETVIAVPDEMADLCCRRTGREPVRLQPAQSVTLCGLRIETVPAYNLRKPSHKQSKGWLGYVLTFDETRVYITGDTDNTPECRAVSCDVLMLPIGGTFTVNAQQAAELTDQISPRVVIPIHYGAMLGGQNAAADFQAKVSDGIETVVLSSVYSNLMIRQYARVLILALLCGIAGYCIGNFIGF